MSDLERFVDAQGPVMGQVTRELRAGRKRGHWMWFVFPQLRGLGRSPTAQHYGIADLAEARAYLRHPILGPRLVECTEIVNALPGQDLFAVFGSPDDLKLHSCLTLFRAAADEPTPFQAALDKYFAGEPDRATLRLLQEPNR